MNRIAILVASIFAAAVAPAAEGEASFVHDQGGRKVTVRYFVPPGAAPSAPVVFVLHGVGRNGEDYLADWRPCAAERKFVLVVPEFSKAEFPGVENFNLGRTIDAAGRPLPREQWSFSAIETIFDAVCARTGNTSVRYRLFGHSAGAQFVHRFVFFVPAARLERVVCANAGWYTLPDFTVAFPYGLKGTPVSPDDLRHALGLPVVVLLGTADTDPNANSLRQTPEALAQGPDRNARGRFFFARAEAAAQAQRAAFAWRLATAPNIAHSDKDMVPFAAQALFPEPSF